ncbi:hypothetical protein F4821DRAFT_34789 [Hypoxylon rubiginosum]|uniref:Uncharacterized protein n=1 Tax=Hypoxylon rubiginosum TaxID=110542 RepID=A0ACC0CL38_9PEZI|nr:hypothetical protein F4821DRAFT_34789 [Hypoxylon rubiginosum]
MATPNSWGIPQEYEDLVAIVRDSGVWKGLDTKRQALDNRMDQILQMLGSCIWNIEDQFKAAVRARAPEAAWKPNLSLHVRRLWAQIYTAARFSSPEYRDRLVVELMLLHGADNMTCVGDDNRTIVASLANRVLWADMPFFAEDMIYFWNLEFAAMSRSQRRNLHYVLATAAGGNIVSDKLCAVGILVLREAFETPREMGTDDSVDDEDGEDGNRTIRDLTVLDLLGCAELWLLKARDPIMRLSANGFSDYPPEIGRLGPLAREAGVPDNGGLSQERLDFWRRRLWDVIRSRHPERDGRVPQERWPDSWDSWNP